MSPTSPTLWTCPCRPFKPGCGPRTKPDYWTRQLAGPGCYRFGHGLLHDAVLALVPSSERAAVHAAIASNNAAGVATAAYEDVISVADHAWRAGSVLNPE